MIGNFKWRSLNDTFLRNNHKKINFIHDTLYYIPKMLMSISALIRTINPKMRPYQPYQTHTNCESQYYRTGVIQYLNKHVRMDQFRIFKFKNRFLKVM